MAGMPVSLKCEIDANPLSVAKWVKDDGRQSTTPSSLPEESATNPNDGTLNFTAIAKLDAGWYRCTTQHQFGYFASFGYYLNVRSKQQRVLLLVAILVAFGSFWYYHFLTLVAL